MDSGNRDRATKKIQDLGKILVKEELTAKYKQISDILKIPEDERTEAQKEALLFSPDVVSKCLANKKKSERLKSQKLEVEDSAEVLEEKCMKLTAAIHRSKSLVVYTGAGISTAADIPDYRGPNGVWTLKEKGLSVVTKDLCEAEPTFTHMALLQLMRLGKVKHIVSQNCDGLHVRSGITRKNLSEIHGNMYLEICPQCERNNEYMRLFDVTEKTAIRKHNTGRYCHRCDTELKDTIVHFGEKGNMESPYLWEEARSAVESADMILCLGTSLKVLKSYACLWCMDRPKKKRPPLYIVNLQWTPKDEAAILKIRGDCDTVMKTIMEKLTITVPPYIKYFDPLFELAVQLRPHEMLTKTKKDLCRGDLKVDHNYSIPEKTDDKFTVQPGWIENSVSTNALQPISELSTPGWYGLGLRTTKAKRKRL